MTEIGPFRSRLDKGFEAYLVKCKGKPKSSGLPLQEYVRWLNPDHVNMGKFNTPGNTSIMLSAHLTYMWQFSKSRMFFDDIVLRNLIETESPELVPNEILKRLPYWSQWIELPINVSPVIKTDTKRDLTMLFSGAFVGYTTIGGVPSLGIAAPCTIADTSAMRTSLVTATAYIPLDGENRVFDLDTLHCHILNTSEDLAEEEAHSLIATVMQFVIKFLSCVIYVCSQEEPMAREGIVRDKPKRVGQSYKLSPAKEVRAFNIGQELVQTLKEYEEAAGRVFNGRRPHVRCGHYHHYWTGPRSGSQKLICKWLPPCVVRGIAVE
jgi:hypothetical protein